MNTSVLNVNALLYDWHNSFLLKDQNSDIEYFISQIRCYKAFEVLIIGAGTGRVAIPLSKYAKISALDIDKERLNILQSKDNNINIIHSDICNYISNKQYDLIIAPYSTLQLINPETNLKKCFSKIKKLLKPHSLFLFDLSSGFNTKTNKDWFIKLKKYNSNFKTIITEYQKIERKQNHIVINTKYVDTCNFVLSQYEEIWYFLDEVLIEKYFQLSGFNLIKLDKGYNNSTSLHRYIYFLQN